MHELFAKEEAGLRERNISGFTGIGEVEQKHVAARDTEALEAIEAAFA